MSNELKEICRRLECDSIIDPKGIFVVTKAVKVKGGWELKVIRQEETEGTNDNN